MDFKEYLMKRNKSKIEVLYTVLLYIAATALSLICLIFIPPIGGINMLIVAGFYFGAHKLSCKFKREYEYILTQNTVDIDVIFNQSSRKRLISFTVSEMESIAPASDNGFSDERTFSKVIDATTNRKDASVYYAVVEKGGRILVKFEPPYAMLEILKKYEPRKVTIGENK